MMLLTEQQQSVLTHVNGHLVVLAGPGSGKTRTLIEKIIYIFDQKILSEPNGLLAITFSNTAVNEIRTRLRQKNFKYRDYVQIQTFHGLANYMLRCYGSDVGIREDFIILDSNEQIQLLKALLSKYSSSWSHYQFQSVIDKFKQQGIYPTHQKFYSYGDRRFLDAYTDYQNELTQKNMLDFSDLVYFAIKLLKDSHLAYTLFTRYFRYIIVDEFQDTDYQQLELIKLLTGTTVGSTIFADDDQAIYGFRGADKRNVQKISQQLNATQIELAENFRLPEVIVEAAHALIGQESDRIDKYSVIKSQEKGLLVKCEFEDDKAEAIAVGKWIMDLQSKVEVDNLGQIAIVARNRNRSTIVEKILTESNIPLFDRSRLTFTDSWDAITALAILALSCELGSSDKLYALMSAIENSGISYQISDLDAIDIACIIREKLRDIADSDIHPDNAWAILEKSELFKIIQQVSANTGEYERLLKNIRNVTSDITTQSKNRNCTLREIIKILSGEDAVQLVTSHGSKGKEFDYVFFIGVEDDVIPPSWRNPSEEEISEDRRVFYVTLTRTRKGLYISYAKRVSGRSNKKPSRFLNDIPETFFNL